MGADLSLRQVRQVRGGSEILRVDELDVCDGEHVSVLGPNGAGKTTLLRLLASVDRPASGTVTLDGVSTARGGVELRRQVAYATQQPGLLSTSVRRNVELPLRWRKVPRKERARVAAAALERLRVAHLADRRAHELSGGEQQRVNLARALALDPSVLLLDEPAAGLDAQTRSAFFADLEQALADRTATVVHVSHRAEEALRFADRVVVLVDGRVHQVGTPDALTLRPADASVAALVGYDNLVDATVRARRLGAGRRRPDRAGAPGTGRGGDGGGVRLWRAPGRRRSHRPSGAGHARHPRTRLSRGRARGSGVAGCAPADRVPGAGAR